MLTRNQTEVIRIVERRLDLVERAFGRCFGTDPNDTLIADLRYLEIDEIAVDGQPLAEMEGETRRALAVLINDLRQAINRAVAELGSEA